MKNKINCTWTGNMAFETHIDAHKIIMDADESVGGNNRGPRPKALTLASLGGCTGMDVISILAKMKVIPDFFDIEIEGELSEEHPKYYHTIHLTYVFKGKSLPMEKLQKAVSLSQEKYCGVSKLLKAGTHIDYEIKIIE